MIILIEKIIREKLSDKYDFKKENLHFLKFSTAGSGGGSFDKVLFFVFKDKESSPFLVVKTTRTYKDKFVIAEGFKRLEKLNKLTKNTKHEKMFPRAIYLYDDNQEFIFSIETFCFGRKSRKNETDLRFILHKYTNWQKTQLAQGIGQIDDVGAYGLQIVKDLGLLEKDYRIVEDYFLNLLRERKIVISKIYQHGDFTSDNVFVSKDNISIVDCDRFGVVLLPGVDIFHMISRFYGKKIGKYHFTFLSQYFKDLEINIALEPFLYFIYYLHELSFKKDYFPDKKNAQIIIDDFKELIK